jgi:hypothetical protein
MKYEELDGFLEPFAARHGFHIVHRAKECEVRDITIVDDGGNVYGMNISLDDGDQLIVVGVGYRHILGNKKREDYRRMEANIENFEELLEEAYGIVLAWIAESGNSRTPILTRTHLSLDAETQ